MEWLAQLNGQALAGAGATGAVLIAGLIYVVKFQKSFTSRLEQQGDRDVARIEKLELDVTSRTIELQKEREYASRLRLQLIENGVEPKPRDGVSP